MAKINSYIKEKREGFKGPRGNTLTQKEVAESLDISVKQYQRYENDHVITPPTIMALSEILKFDINEAFEIYISEYVSGKDIKSLKKAQGIEGDRATITALVQAVQELQDYIFAKFNDKLKINISESAHSILLKRQREEE